MLCVPVVQRDWYQIFDWGTPLFGEVITSVQSIDGAGVRLIASLQSNIVTVSGQGLISPNLSGPLVGGELQLQMVGRYDGSESIEARSAEDCVVGGRRLHHQEIHQSPGLPWILTCGHSQSYYSFRRNGVAGKPYQGGANRPQMTVKSGHS